MGHHSTGADAMTVRGLWPIATERTQCHLGRFKGGGQRGLLDRQVTGRRQVEPGREKLAAGIELRRSHADARDDRVNVVLRRPTEPLLVDRHREPPPSLDHEEQPPVAIVTKPLHHTSGGHPEAVIDPLKKPLRVIGPRLGLGLFPENSHRLRQDVWRIPALIRPALDFNLHPLSDVGRRISLGLPVACPPRIGNLDPDASRVVLHNHPVATPPSHDAADSHRMSGVKQGRHHHARNRDELPRGGWLTWPGSNFCRHRGHCDHRHSMPPLHGRHNSLLILAERFCSLASRFGSETVERPQSSKTSSIVLRPSVTVA